MNNRLCFISRNYRGVESSGNKAKTDNEQTLRQMGAKNLGLPTTYYNNKVVTFFLDLAGIVKMMLTVRPGDVILLQYPVKKYFSFICNVAHCRKAKVVALIHDLGSMRRKKLTVKKEISRLMHADEVIASNETMAEWLRSNGYEHPLGALGLFDYRSKALTPPAGKQMPLVPTLVYAGALAMRKNAFLLKMDGREMSYKLDIYGNKEGLPGIKESEYVSIHGFMPAEEFIAHVPGDFGFVWDGDSMDSCTGDFGEYLRWNSPHKVSFYLRAGLPVIIWREAALAPMIEREGIGLAIGSIAELNELLAQITPEQMWQMRENVQRVSRKLAAGGFLQDALSETELLKEGKA